MALMTNQREILRSERIAGGILPSALNSFDMVAVAVFYVGPKMIENDVSDEEIIAEVMR